LVRTFIISYKGGQK